MSFGAPKRTPGDSSTNSFSRKQSTLSSSMIRKSPVGGGAATNSSRNSSASAMLSKTHSLNLSNTFSAASRPNSPAAQHTHHHQSSFSQRNNKSNNNNNNRISPRVKNARNISNSAASKSQSPQQPHHNHNNNNHHLFALRGEKYSMASDLFGFTDQMDPNPFQHLEDEHLSLLDDTNNIDPASPLRAALNQLQNGIVPSSCQLSPETYDSLAVMERMNHTRRMLESMQVERRECLTHMDRGKEIYRSLFARKIGDDQMNQIADDMLGLNNNKKSETSIERKQRRRENNNNNEFDENNSFDFRHEKGEPKLQTTPQSIARQQQKRRNGENNNNNDSNETPPPQIQHRHDNNTGGGESVLENDSFTASLMKLGYQPPSSNTKSVETTNKKESVFERLSKTPPPPSWVEEAQRAAAHSSSRSNANINNPHSRPRNDTPKKPAFGVRSSRGISSTAQDSYYSKKMRELEELKQKEEEELQEKMNQREERKRQSEERKRERENKRTSKKNNKKKNKHGNNDDENGKDNDDVDVIPSRFKDLEATNSFSEENDDETPQIIRTPIPVDAYRQYMSNYTQGEVVVTNDNIDENSTSRALMTEEYGNSHYTIEYSSPAKLPMGLLQTGSSNNSSSIQPGGRNYSSSSNGGGGVTYGSNNSMMPLNYRMQDPATNFGDNLEWTGGVQWS